MTKTMFLISFLLLLASCSYPLGLISTAATDASSNGDNGASSISTIDPQLMASALTILQKNCTSCHGSSSGPAGIYSLASATHLFSSGMLIAGNPDSSPLFQSIQAGRMPPNSPLSAADQNTIKSFILAAGTAAENNSSYQPPTPEPTYTYIKNSITGPKCSGCHYTGHADGGYAFDTYLSTIKSVNKNTPTQSKIYTVSQKGEMPPSPSPQLNSEELQLILTWIQSGAPNN